MYYHWGLEVVETKLELGQGEAVLAHLLAVGDHATGQLHFLGAHKHPAIPPPWLWAGMGVLLLNWRDSRAGGCWSDRS